MSLENSKNNKLIISESNYSCEYFDEEYIKQKNNKSKKLYNLEEKEREIYDNQEQLSKKMIKILSKNKNKITEIELYYNNALNKKQKKVNQKELNEIVKRLSTPKKEKINLNIIKPNNNSHRNIFINGGNNNNIKLNNNNNDINCKINKKSNKIRKLKKKKNF